MAISIPLPIEKGGTNSTTAGDALTALGAATSAQGALADTAIQPNTSATLSSLSVDDTDPLEGESVQINPGGITLYSGAVISFDGTGTDAAKATTRTNLGAVSKSGDTMTGKLTAAADDTSAKFNIGNAITGTNPTNTVNGDLWITGGNRLAYRSNSTNYSTAQTNLANTFNNNQTIDTSTAIVALRVTQRGTGEALRVEDETTPDATAFVVSNSGRVGIGVTPDASVCLSLDSTGVKFSDGTIQTTATLSRLRGQISKMTSGTITIATQGVYQSTGLTGTLDATTANGMVLGTTDTFAVKNTSGATRIFRIYASMDAVAGNNETLGIKLAKNGTVIDETECRANTNNNAFAKLVTSWMVSMANNDEIALFVANHSSTTSLAFQRGRIIASIVD